MAMVALIFKLCRCHRPVDIGSAKQEAAVARPASTTAIWICSSSGPTRFLPSRGPQAQQILIGQGPRLGWPRSLRRWQVRHSLPGS